jgi:hypothetical protein
MMLTASFCPLAAARRAAPSSSRHHRVVVVAANAADPTSRRRTSNHAHNNSINNNVAPATAAAVAGWGHQHLRISLRGRPVPQARRRGLVVAAYAPTQVDLAPSGSTARRQSHSTTTPPPPRIARGASLRTRGFAGLVAPLIAPTDQWGMWAAILCASSFGLWVGWARMNFSVSCPHRTLHSANQSPVA